MRKNQAFGILSAASDAHVARIITEHEQKFSRINVWRTARALRRGVPVAKIIHQKWFYGLKFYTNKYTLDPRPETETLVRAVLTDCAVQPPPKILDLGTGTGCIICSLVKNVPDATGVGIDSSGAAVRVAKRNVRDLGLSDKIKIKKANFNNVSDWGAETFDIIVSNPPYIAPGDFRVDIGAKHDPKIALYAQDDGLAAYKKIAQNARSRIKPKGKIYLEIGMGQGKDVRKIFSSFGWKFVRAESDLGKIERVLVFQKI